MAKLIYIAGKFTAPTREGVDANIAAAVQVGIEVAKLGGMPVIPHANTAHPEFEHVQPYQFWIEGTMRLLEKCDAIVLCPGWAESKGALGEAARGAELKMQGFIWPRDAEALAQWIRGEE